MNLKFVFLSIAFLCACATLNNRTPSSDIIYNSDFIQAEGIAPQAHSATLAVLTPIHKLLACWYSGSREMGPDVQIYCSTADLNDTKWSTPTVAVKAQEKQTGDILKSKSLGNPVLFFDEDSKVTYLFFGTVTVGGWRGVRPFYRTSTDYGATWSASIKVDGSFPGDSDTLGRIGKFVRAKPLALSKQEFLLPMYSEWDEKRSFTCSFKKSDELYKETQCEVMPGKGSLQPSLVQTQNGLYAYTRSKTGYVQYSKYNLEKKEWSELSDLNVLNPDSSIDTLATSREEILLVGNLASNNRRSLDLMFSKDGKKFERIFTFEKSDDELVEFSYPAFIKTTDGHYHLAYTYKRVGIKHLHFNEAWLDQQIEKVQ
ncbi:MAG: exo-alpha-sialidase [Bdellovibrionaceae bacterium]|nr:exo-alpha-sialidase [Bdellovibrio sp.]